MADRRLVLAGTNNWGQCLLPGTESIGVPTVAPLGWLPDDRRAVRFAAGSGFALLADDVGRLWAAGHNIYGQLGRGHTNGDAIDDICIPRLVAGIGGVRITQIAAGYGHCAAVTEAGKLLTWGWNGCGQCGTGTAGHAVLAARHYATGVLADGDVRVAFAACGFDHTVAVTTDGGVVVLGENSGGQLGTGNGDRQLVSVLLACTALDGVTIVGCAAGANFTYLLSDGGRVFAMGDNDRGQLGTGDTDEVNTPTEIDAARFGGIPVAVVVCGFEHVLAITAEGKLYACGRGDEGATGLGHTNCVTTPQPVVGALADARVVRIATGLHHSCALAEDGRVFAFGDGGGVPAAGAQGIPQLLQDALAGTTVCALGVGCGAQNSAFVGGTPPDEPGFETLLTFEMRKPAAKEPDPLAVAAVLAQGTKRKRDANGGVDDDDDDDDSEREREESLLRGGASGRANPGQWSVSTSDDDEDEGAAGCTPGDGDGSEVVPLC